jgi:hypothetical protein
VREVRIYFWARVTARVRARIMAIRLREKKRARAGSRNSPKKF